MGRGGEVVVTGVTCAVCVCLKNNKKRPDGWTRPTSTRAPPAAQPPRAGPAPA